MKLTLGIDVGNSNIKSVNTTFPSGYTSYSVKPAMAKKYLHYKDNYYVLSPNRKPYREDKTEDGRCIIFTLFSIAEEILDSCKGKSPEEIQNRIDRITSINLAIGLPPADMTNLKEKTEEFYKKEFENGIHFEYNNYTFLFRLDNVYVFPQNYSAIVTAKSSNIINKYPKYYVIDIGGITVDIICMMNGEPVPEDVDSKKIGMLTLYENVIKRVKQETGLTIDQTCIESILKKEPNTLKENVVTSIQNGCMAWADYLLDELSQSGIEFQSYPVVFIGGGSKALKPYIEKSSLLGVHEFITDTHANARGFQLLAKAISEQEK